MKKIVLLAFVLVLLSTAVVVGFIKPVNADETIYIRADGSIEGTTDISSADNITYTVTANIFNQSIIIERNDIVVDGAGYTLQGTEAENSRGISLYERSNITIKNIKIKKFWYGIFLYKSSNNTISGNNLTENRWIVINLDRSSNNTISRNNITANEYATGVELKHSSNNRICGNTIIRNSFNHGIYVLFSSNNNNFSENNIANNWRGIRLQEVSNNRISGNNIRNNNWGIDLDRSSNNIVAGNNITNNYVGIYLILNSSNNRIYHNNLIDNTEQVSIVTSGYANFWDNGADGNYWSDYEERYPNATEIDESGIWNTPYVIDSDNQDNYPLMNPSSPQNIVEVPFWMQWWFWIILAIVIILLTGAVYFLKRRKPPTATAPTQGTKLVLQLQVS